MRYLINPTSWRLDIFPKWTFLLLYLKLTNSPKRKCSPCCPTIETSIFWIVPIVTIKSKIKLPQLNYNSETNMGRVVHLYSNTRGEKQVWTTAVDIAGPDFTLLWIDWKLFLYSAGPFQLKVRWHISLSLWSQRQPLSVIVSLVYRLNLLPLRSQTTVAFAITD